ncbi:MAG: undecaprenyldiphospho-muramoylpentapeptide beta-N-acetylglucosaminyltransferase [Gemmatimonadota bacterium]
MSRTVLIAGGGTGGHLMPALAIAECLRATHADLEPVLVGATRGIESTVLPTRSFRHYLLPAEPLYRRQWWKNIRWPFIAMRLVREAGAVLDKEQPAVVIGTGGYASAPIVWLAARRGISTALQEQNAFPGMATRRLARMVRQVYLGLPEAAAKLSPGPRTSIFETGNPILPPDSARRSAGVTRFSLTPGRPVLLVTGGSQGALAINRVVAEWLRLGGGRDITVLWAAGKTSYQEFAGLHQPSDVQVFDFLDPMADAMAVADLAVARAGAITLAELCAWGVPSILVPLPTAAADHQSSNARALAAAGAAVHLPQSELSADTLGKAVMELITNQGARRAMGEAALKRGRPNAAAEIVAHIVSLIS